MSEEIDRGVVFRIDLAEHSLDLSNLPVDNGRKDSKQAARGRHLTAKVSPVSSSELPIKDAPCRGLSSNGTGFRAKACYRPEMRLRRIHE